MDEDCADNGTGHGNWGVVMVVSDCADGTVEAGGRASTGGLMGWCEDAELAAVGVVGGEGCEFGV